MTTDTDLGAAVAAIRDHDRFLVTSHENPDGDALGSVLAMHLALRQLGKDSLLVLTGEAPLPGEYRFLELPEHGLQRSLPEDRHERVLLALDCANATRAADPAILEGAPLSVNIDHHHDNTRFADVNVVVPDASSTGEILAEVFARLDVRLTGEIAEPLYVALVTDTGRFQYTNTTPKAFRLAAELVEAGVDVHRVFQGIYESVDFHRLKLLGIALQRARLYEGGRFVVSYLLRSDFTDAGVGEEYAEGIIDHLRAVEGAELAATIREPPDPPDALRRISMRSSREELDVSAIARKRGGGGHRQAAGFSTAEPIEEIVAFIRGEFAAVGAPASA